jgi:hypothetical protein
MPKIERIVLGFLLALLFFGCRTQQTSSGSKFYGSLDDFQKTTVDTWKADPYGCNHKRDPENASAILSWIDKAKLNKDHVIAVLGPAEESSSKNGIDYLGYMLDQSCANGKPTSESVGCVLQCYFDAATQAWKQGTVVCG